MTTLQSAVMPQDAIAELPDPKNPIKRIGAYVSMSWLTWLQSVLTWLGRCPNRVGQVVLTDQTASIGATDLGDGTLGAGLYRVTYYARITRPATTSSSLIVTISWTDNGQAMSQSGAAITGNLTSSGQTGSTLIYSAGASPISYSATYASVGATSMSYKLAVVLEQVYSA